MPYTRVMKKIKNSLYLAVPQTHEGCNSESCSGGLRQHAEDALYFLKRVGIGFLRLSGLRIDRRVAGRVLALKIILLLRQRENAAHNALHVFQSIAA